MDDRDRKTMERAVDSARIAIEHVRTGGADWRSDQRTVAAAAKRVEEVSERSPALADTVESAPR